MTDAQQDRHHEHLHRETKKSDPDSTGAIQPRGEERYKWGDLNSKEKKALRARLLGAFVGGLCRPCVCDRWHRGCGAVGGRLGYGGVRLYGSCLEVVWKLSDAGSEVMGCLAVGWRLSGSWLALKRDSWLDWCGGFCRPCV